MTELADLEGPPLAGAPEPASASVRALRTRLIVLSFLMLFLELALIRWLGAHILYLSYFSNIVLLGSFLGIGLGFLRASRSTLSLLPFAPLALAVLVVAVRLIEPKVEVSGGTLIFLGLNTSGPPRWVVLPVVFLSVAAVLACVGDGVARTFSELKSLDAYNFDLIGSLIGTVGFAALSYFHGVPVLWALIVSAGLVFAVRPRTRNTVLLTGLPLLALVGVLFVESLESDSVWTPYYKVTTEPIGKTGGVVATVNGVPTWYQFRAIDNAIYQTSYDRMTSLSPGRVLVIGAGSGNDVSVAVYREATSVDAVEIDAHLLDLGRGHPDRPYDSPIVHTHINDGRAFIQQSDKKWDTIFLALPDSLTLVQGNSAVRLESYLFTKQAVEQYRDHLAPGGVFSMYNYYREHWLVDRYAGTLEDVFGRPPCLDAVDTLSILTVSSDPGAVTCPAGHTWVRGTNVPSPATDDAPFPYLRHRSIPAFYLIVIAIIFAVSVLGVRAVGGPFKPMRRHADMFFLGVAFLLLETKNVVQFALLFGTTWLVNALVFAGVLLSVLLAVAVSKRVRFARRTPLYIALAASLVLAYLVPGSALLDLSAIPRFLAAVGLAFLPIFTANLIFAQRFRDTDESTSAFGANLLGAMVGGLLEYASLVVGFRNLLIIVAVAYAAAFVTGRAPRAVPAAAEASA